MGNIEDALRHEQAMLEQALSKSPEYQRLTIIRKALMELKALRSSSPTVTVPLNTLFRTVHNDKRQATSIGQGAEFAIEDRGTPLTTRELLAILPEYGKEPAGKNPATNLSNNLSSDARFKSVMYKNNSAWWLIRLGEAPSE
jgi:hypothetical protein